MTRFLAITFVLSLMVSVVRTAPAGKSHTVVYSYSISILLIITLLSDHSILLKKNSDNPQWDDLGWAWGKRSSPVDDPEVSGPWKQLISK